MNTKCNLTDQIKAISSKTEAAFQTILMLAHDSNFDGIQMELIWKLLETCVIPIITYSSETWNPTKHETKQINSILDNLIKRILKTPITTPREALYIETGLLDPKAIMDKKRIMMKRKGNATDIGKSLDNSDNKKTWNEVTKQILQEYKLPEPVPNSTKKKDYAQSEK